MTTGIVSFNIQLEYGDDGHDAEVSEAVETLRGAGFEVVDFDVLDHEVLTGD